jgi:hypothetical protein
MSNIDEQIIQLRSKIDRLQSDILKHERTLARKFGGRTNLTEAEHREKDDLRYMLADLRIVLGTTTQEFNMLRMSKK